MVSLILLYSSVIFCQSGSFRIRADNYLQIGYDNYKVLTFGQGSASFPNQNNGAWGIEHWNGGLNFHRAWPVFSAGNYKLFIKDWDGFVGIGKYPVHKLDVVGNIGTSGSFLLTSDERLKKNITAMDSKNCLSLITSLKTYTYIYNYNDEVFFPALDENVEMTEIKAKTIESDKAINDGKLKRGFMAQEVEGIIPDIVNKAEDGSYSIDYIAVLPILVEAVKEQQQIIEEMKKEIEILKQK